MVASSQLSDLRNKSKEIANKKENLWSSILNEVQNQSNPKLSGCKNVLVLGDNESGKTTMVAKLQGVEDSRKGSGLEYAYIDVRDEYREDTTRLSVWVLDGDPGHSSLLKFALTKESYRDTLVILAVSMTTPWEWMDQLQHWTTVLGKHIDKLNLDQEEQQGARSRAVWEWQKYVEPCDELDSNSPVKRHKKDMIRNTDEFDSPLGTVTDGALVTNLGMDIVVVVTKTDYMSTLEKDLDYRDEHWDFMQQWIRRFCLQHGAALFYTSAKEDTNCDLLYKYLTHRIYEQPFRTPALVVEKDAVLIPAGWDNLKKISILHENLYSCKSDDYYRSVISQPLSRKSVASRDNEILAEDEQSFLERQQALLQNAIGASVPALLPRGPESPLRSTVSLVVPKTPIIPGQSPKKIDSTKMNPVGPGGASVLADFFNSLLTKTANTPTAGIASAVNSNGSIDLNSDRKATLRSDIAIELDRLSREKNVSSVDIDLQMTSD